MLLLVLLNGLTTILSFYFPTVELFVKGSPLIIVKDGAIQRKAMKKNFITERELFNELQSQLHTKDLTTVESAILLTDGTINFIKKK